MHARTTAKIKQELFYQRQNTKRLLAIETKSPKEETMNIDTYSTTNKNNDPNYQNRK
jgi:23S rRNA-/tRNA-specific pseudouridylate synthase